MSDLARESAAAAYAALLRRLQAPPARVIGDEALLERLHPHELPADADWPTPAGDADVRALYERLSRDAVRICMLTSLAVEHPARGKPGPPTERDHQLFYRRWWTRCRCRLAVADPGALELA